TLTGTQLNGQSEGASYGDDAEMSSNYPIVYLTDGSGNVFYARTSNWSTTGVQTGSLTETVTFTLPTGMPLGSYSLFVSCAGLSSTAFPFSTGGGTDTWDGGGSDSNWTTAANWVGDVAPLAGDNLVFPSGAVQLSNTNNFASGTVFNSLTVSGGGYS